MSDTDVLKKNKVERGNKSSDCVYNGERTNDLILIQERAEDENVNHGDVLIEDSR
jgi:hypothetical protein